MRRRDDRRRRRCHRDLRPAGRDRSSLTEPDRDLSAAERRHPRRRHDDRDLHRHRRQRQQLVELFAVVVTHEAPPTPPSAGAVGEPVGPGGTFVANHGRTIPVKVALSVGGTAATTGSATTVTPCGGGSAVTQPLAYSGGRWNANFDTSRVGPTATP